MFHWVSYNKKRGGKLGKKAQKYLVKATETQKDDLITAVFSPVTSVWISDACYKFYTHPINANKTVTVGDECAGIERNGTRKCK